MPVKKTPDEKNEMNLHTLEILTSFSGLVHTKQQVIN